jgi:hypothetical protein
MTFLLFLMACGFGIGAVCDREQENRNNYTWITITCILAIVVIKSLRG